VPQLTVQPAITSTVRIGINIGIREISTPVGVGHLISPDRAKFGVAPEVLSRDPWNTRAKFRRPRPSGLGSLGF